MTLLTKRALEGIVPSPGIRADLMDTIQLITTWISPGMIA